MINLLSNKSSEKESEILKKIDEISEDLKNVLKELIAGDYKLDNIETKMTEILSDLRRKATNELIEEKDVTEMICPCCGEKMKNKEKLKRKIIGLVTYDIKRRSFYCEKCKKYERPLDNIIGCKNYTLEIKKIMILLGQRIPFEESSDYIKKILNVDVPDESIRKLVEETGKQISMDEKERVNEVINKEGFVKKPLEIEEMINDTAYLEMDGSMVQTRELKWKEVKNGILFCQKDVAEIDKHHNIILNKKYYSVFNNGESSLDIFKQRTTQESYDFGFHKYKTKVIIGDGASWIWDYAELYQPEAIQILDYYHAAEYLGNAMETILYENEKCKKEQKEKMFDNLKFGNINGIILFLEKQKETEKIKDCIRYYKKNIHRMKYKEYRDMGLEIGSGAIESAHRIIVQTRMKQSGMHWGKNNVQSILSLRAKYLSDEWGEIVNIYLKGVA